ncbi:hypothetical protein GCM10009819_01720 [Agromyces tropicus]|uniref:Uncharacterized protein n=1 Tax=Agromyces tropicus TaxID=555371 RepID=A0ABP5FBV4_9MICO
MSASERTDATVPTDAAPQEHPTTDAAPAPFTMLGDASAMACEGDACLIPGSPLPDPAT